MKAFIFAALLAATSFAMACPGNMNKACGLNQCKGNYFDVVKSKSQNSSNAATPVIDGSSNRQH